MPRRNNRPAGYEPLDLTAPLPPKQQAPSAWESSREARARESRRHEELDRQQRNARANQGIDWTICLVPGCAKELWRWVRGDCPVEERDHLRRLPLCLDHLAVAAKQAARRDDPLMVEAVATVIQRQATARDDQDRKRKAARLASIDGHIYFIRLNGLIKVGWSRDIAQRINSYGPRVEVLVIYPGTRDDETNLHRQLKPARALGREWYEDGPILADFIAVALEQHGPPREIKTWLMKPKQIVAGKRHR